MPGLEKLCGVSSAIVSVVKELVASALAKDVDNVEVDVSLGGGRPH